jgi:hypothetical protein
VAQEIDHVGQLVGAAARLLRHEGGQSAALEADWAW